MAKSDGDGRAARLEAALRANLKRRKAQAKARGEDGAGAGASDDRLCDGDPSASGPETSGPETSGHKASDQEPRRPADRGEKGDPR